MSQRIVIASDHAGFPLKMRLLARLQEKGFQLEDQGCYSEASVDYPDYAAKAIKRMYDDPQLLGILVCGTGIGMCIAANKFHGIRAAISHDVYTARLAREHNDANVLCLGARCIDEDTAVAVILTWLEAKFIGERHERRIAKITSLETQQTCVTSESAEYAAALSCDTEWLY